MYFMSGIAGIAQSGKQELVHGMLEKIAHRGGAGSKIIEDENATMGMVWPDPQAHLADKMKKEHVVRDETKSGHLAMARIEDDDLFLMRDQIGVAPLYRGVTKNGVVCFASEVKALLDICPEIQEVPPGSTYVDEEFQPYYALEKKTPLTDPPEIIAAELKRRLNKSVLKRIEMGGEIGAWLSGGLDSSSLCALAQQHLGNLHTFAAGLEGASDLKYAREVADFIKSDHREIVPDFNDILKVLPKVIYHLESFDALLVRSSITNYLVAQLASDYVDVVFSGEGGDELFAGYAYLKSLENHEIPDELIDITGRLHNTALQRVDRSAAAHGTIAHVGFLDSDVVEYALRIPPHYKLHNNVEKWILRRAMDGMLPRTVLERTKAKFWQGAGISDKIAAYANEKISDAEFERERNLLNGLKINTKEELLYYRIFKEQFGDLPDLSWMGRTKGAPIEH